MKKLDVNGTELSQEDREFLARLDEEIDIPESFDDIEQLDVSEKLHRRLYAISAVKDTKTEKGARHNRQRTLAIGVSIAASILVAVLSLEYFMTRPNESELRRAHQELAIAFSYLNKANYRANQKVRHTVGANMKRVSVGSVMSTLPSESESL